jgi:hypothetical protein
VRSAAVRVRTSSRRPNKGTIRSRGCMYSSALSFTRDNFLLNANDSNVRHGNQTGVHQVLDDRHQAIEVLRCVDDR